jgi:biopolymer transport protein TolR
MSMNVGSGQRGQLNADINVTPLVDVMLVLLIIMMLVAPLLQKGVDVRLPTAANRVDKPETQDQTVVAIAADKRLYVDAVQIRETELATRVQEKLESKKEKIVLIKADTDAPYSAVMDAMDQLRQAGVEDMGLITDPKVRPGEPTGGK